jgi:hypothetical protein
MVHLRTVAPQEQAQPALELLEACDSVINAIYLRKAAHKPDGDAILCVRGARGCERRDLRPAQPRDRPLRIDRRRERRHGSVARGRAVAHRLKKTMYMPD